MANKLGMEHSTADAGCLQLHLGNATSLEGSFAVKLHCDDDPTQNFIRVGARTKDEDERGKPFYVEMFSVNMSPELAQILRDQLTVALEQHIGQCNAHHAKSVAPVAVVGDSSEERVIQ